MFSLSLFLLVNLALDLDFTYAQIRLRGFIDFSLSGVKVRFLITSNKHSIFIIHREIDA